MALGKAPAFPGVSTLHRPQGSASFLPFAST